MRFSTMIRLGAVLLLPASAAMAQSGKVGPGPETKPAEATGFAPPANDNFANATVITAAGEYLSSTVEATSEAGEPTLPAACAASETGQSVWYKFTSADGTPVTFDTANSALAPGGTAIGFTDTIMSVYTGSALGALTQIACNDDDPTNPTGGGDFTSRIANLAVTAGTTYYVRVTSFFGGAGQFDRSNGEVRLAATGNFQVPNGPALAVSPGTIAFGNVPLNTTVTQTVTLTSTGTTTITVSSITFTGNNGLTATIPTTPLTIAAGTSATVTITFTPTTGAAATGTLTVTSDAPTSPATVTVTGQGSSDIIQSVCSGTITDLPAGQPTTTVGPGGPYPNTLTVSGITAPVTDVNIRLVGITHTFPGDLDIAVQHPAGPSSYVISDAGGGTDITNLTLTLDDEATATVPSPIVAGTYRPTGSTGTFPAPAPTPSGTSFAVFDGADPNGTWSLYVVDDASGDFGTMTDWCVDFTLNGAVAGENGAAALRNALTASPNPIRGTSRIQLAVEQAQDVTVNVYDVTGRQVATLFQGAVSADRALELSLDATSLPSGVYVVRAAGSSVQLSQRVTVIR